MYGSDDSRAKRKRSQSPGPRRHHDSDRHYRDRDAPRRENGDKPRWSHKEQMRLNQLQEDERMREWVSQEDDFVLRQAKKKAEIRVREGRAKPIDWLAVTLRMIDPTRNPLDDDVEDEDLEFVDPDSVFDDLSESRLSDLRKDIETYINLETNRKNRDYWRTMQIICKDKQRKMRAIGPEGRAVSSVSADIDRLLGPKSYDELESLEKQINQKLDSKEPIDRDYWSQLLDNLLIWKAKAKLKNVYKAVLDSRLQKLRLENEREALRSRQQLAQNTDPGNVDPIQYSKSLDPEPSLHIQSQDKGIEVIDESTFLKQVASDRRKVMRMGYVPAPKAATQKGSERSQKPTTTKPQGFEGRFDHSTPDDHSLSTNALFERDVARGVEEDEEIFMAEEEVETRNKDQWKGKYRPRKPKYFNRVQMGYEWNKYNQTHYDHDNPPPKVVQGYKFHIFYPDLIDPSKAPTYKIMREGGRKKGQALAPAGEEDTCIIRFTSGPPYEDIAFRIADRDWDYSAKYDRGFKSTFERGILTLHFTFKKVYYRK